MKVANGRTKAILSWAFGQRLGKLSGMQTLTSQNLVEEALAKRGCQVGESWQHEWRHEAVETMLKGGADRYTCSKTPRPLLSLCRACRYLNGKCLCCPETAVNPISLPSEKE